MEVPVAVDVATEATRLFADESWDVKEVLALAEKRIVFAQLGQATLTAEPKHQSVVKVLSNGVFREVYRQLEAFTLTAIEAHIRATSRC